ncbi:MAG: hypothetical protein KF716_10690 [Anaerolineae bacterium]|nr:hypothetical protein [Anaerolineae bacterium]
MNKKPIDTTTISNELQGASLFFQKPAPIDQNQEIASPNDLAQIHEQVSKPLSNLSSEVLSKPTDMQKIPLSSKEHHLSASLPTAEEIEMMTFSLRKERKGKVNTTIAETWKEELDAIAFELKVGKYELLEYVIGSFLGKVGKKESA